MVGYGAGEKDRDSWNDKISQISEPKHLWDDDLGDRGQGILADAESIGREDPGSERAIRKPVHQTRVAVIVHGDRNLRFQLFDHFLPVFRTHGGDAADGKKEDVNVADQLKLVLVKGLTHVARMKDAETVHFENKS